MAATGTTPATFAHDLNGNMTSDGAGGSYAYDALNRLASASGTNSATLVYGPKGRLISTTAGGTTTQFLYDGGALIAEYVSGAVINRYAHGGGVDDPILWFEGADTATKNYLTTDERGSIIGLTDSSGSSTRINAYDEWGVPEASNVGGFQYTGQIWLHEIGKYYYKARIYDPNLGRFLQTDPIGYEDGMNMYAYVGGDPVNKDDSTGLGFFCPGPEPGETIICVDAPKPDPPSHDDGANLPVINQPADDGTAEPQQEENNDCSDIQNLLGAIAEGLEVASNVTNGISDVAYIASLTGAAPAAGLGLAADITSVGVDGLSFLFDAAAGNDVSGRLGASALKLIPGSAAAKAFSKGPKGTDLENRLSEGLLDALEPETARKCGI